MNSESRRPVRFDPHVHTAASPDAVGPVSDVLQAATEHGLDAVAITDHNTTAGAQRALELEREFDVTVVPGAEISTRDGHLLALGVEVAPPVGDSLEDTVAWVRERDGVAVVPHPFQRSRSGVRKGQIGDCDGLEVFNAWSFLGVQNRRADAFARRGDYPGVGSSDAHWPAMVGAAYTELRTDGAATTEAVLDAVASGRCRAAGRALPRHLLRTCLGGVRQLPRGTAGRLADVAARLRNGSRARAPDAD